MENLWQMWKVDGDLEPAKTNWDTVQAHVAWLKSHLKSKGIKMLNEPYGDWCPPPTKPGKTDKATASKHFAAAASLIRQIMQVRDLGKAIGGKAAADGEAAGAWHTSLQQEYHNAYYNNATQSYDNGQMLTYVLPLATGATPDSEKAAVLKNLIKDIADHNGTWSGGIINNRYLFDVLHDNGAAELALSMLKRKAYPSYGYMYFNDLEPATEGMWELPDAPYQGDGMNSRAHHMYSSVGAYLVRAAGLSFDAPGFLVTATVGHLDASEASLSSPFGDIRFQWKRESGLTLDVSIPVGLQADIFVPSEDGMVTMMRQGQAQAVETTQDGVLRDGRRHTQIRVGAGRFQFKAQAVDELVV